MWSKLVRLPAGHGRPPTTSLFLFEFLRVSGEGRLVSDLSFERRDAGQQRVACRLAYISAPPDTRGQQAISCRQKQETNHQISTITEQKIPNDMDTLKKKNILKKGTDTFKKPSEKHHVTFCTDKADVELATTTVTLVEDVIVETALNASLRNIIDDSENTTSGFYPPRCLQLDDGGDFY